MRRRLRRGSVLGDLRAGGRFGGVPAVPANPEPGPGVGVITPPMMQPGAVGGFALAPGVFDITHFASGIRPVQILAALPALPDANFPPGAHVYLTTDNHLYHVNPAGSAWERLTEDQDEIAGSRIVADSITAGQIAAGAIGASEIAARAVTTEKLTVGVLQDSVLLNAGFEEVDSANASQPAAWGWQGTGGGYGERNTSVVRSGIASGGCVAGGPAATGALFTPNLLMVPVSPADNWFVSAWYRSSVAITQGAYIEVAWYNASKVYVSSSYTLVNASASTTFTKSEGVVTVPAGVAFAQVIIWNFQPNVSSTIYYDDITFQRAVGSAMILDAAIVNAKIANLSVTNIKIGDLTIEAAKYKQVRNVIEIPFDDSVDSTHPLECFFQMPTGVVTIKSVKIWVHQKSFRAYETSASSGGGGTSGATGSTTTSATTHTHSLSLATGNTGSNSTGSSAHTTDAQGGHDHTDPQGGLTGFGPTHSHNVNSHSHGHSHTYVEPAISTLPGGGHDHTVPDHTHSVGAHTHGITYGIFEQAAAGNFSVDTSNDGTTASYVNRVASQAPPINSADITAGFTTTAGDRRVRINATGLSRAQVLLVMDLILELGAP